MVTDGGDYSEEPRGTLFVILMVVRFFLILRFSHASRKTTLFGGAGNAMFGETYFGFASNPICDQAHPRAPQSHRSRSEVTC